MQQHVPEVEVLLPQRSVCGSLAVLQLERLRALGGAWPFMLRQRGQHRVTGHQPRDEEVEGDGGDRGQQVEAEAPEEDLMSVPSCRLRACAASCSAARALVRARGSAMSGDAARGPCSGPPRTSRGRPRVVGSTQRVWSTGAPRTGRAACGQPSRPSRAAAGGRWSAGGRCGRPAGCRRSRRRRRRRAPCTPALPQRPHRAGRGQVVVGEHRVEARRPPSTSAATAARPPSKVKSPSTTWLGRDREAGLGVAPGRSPRAAPRCSRTARRPGRRPAAGGPVEQVPRRVLGPRAVGRRDRREQRLVPAVVDHHDRQAAGVQARRCSRGCPRARSPAARRRSAPTPGWRTGASTPRRGCR